MELIAIVDKNWGIGNNGALLFNLPPDMARFKQLTSGHVVIMGRKTAESLPHGKPLNDRINILLTRQKDYKKEGFIIVNTLIELEKLAINCFDKKMFVIGGAEIYKLLISICDRAYITKVDAQLQSDCKMINLDNDKQWKATYESQWVSFDNLHYCFVTYERIENVI